MPWYANLFAQAAAPAEPPSSMWQLNVLVALGTIIVSVVLGTYLGKKLRMPDHGWKIGVILFSFLASVAVVTMGPQLKLGVDLRGGVILDYEVDMSKRADHKSLSVQEMEELIAAVKRRVNPGGQKEVVIRPKGQDMIEIIDPIGKAEVDHIKRIISSQGSLQFRILATRRVNSEVVERALAESTKYRLYDAAGNLEAWWVPVKKGQEESIVGRGGGDIAVRTREKDHERITEVLVLNDPYNVTGQYLTRAAEGTDENGQRCVTFAFTAQGGQLFGQLTGTHLPDKQTDFAYRLGVVLDDELYSAPRIQSRIEEHGQITGSFSREDVKFQVDVLNAGKLPAALTKEPISELYSGATLGSDTITKSLHAMLVASILVPIFMLLYYRFCGLVANIALVLNMLILFAVMLMFHAAFTLTGFAGLALTVGMAVDNNILVFERLREERDRGATLRMAIRNAFHRAGTTIIDCNLTHMIAATVLWFIGSDQLKGFAVTLWIGVVTSIFTAVFVSHVIFEVAEKRQWISDVKMARWIGHTQIDFMSWFPLCLTASILITIMAIVVSIVRGPGLFDIDFTGGVSVQAVFDQPQKINDVRKLLSEGREEERLPDLAVTDVRMEGQEPGLQFIVNTSEGDPKKVQDKLKQVFGNKLAHNSFDYTAPEVIRAAAPKENVPTPKETPPLPKEDTKAKQATSPGKESPAKKPAEAPNKGQSRRGLPLRSLLALAGDASLGLALVDDAAPPAAGAVGPSAGDKAATKTASSKAAETPSTKAPLLPKDMTSVAAPENAAIVSPDVFVGGSEAKLTFKTEVNYEALDQMIKDAMAATGINADNTPHEFHNPKHMEGERVPFHDWTLRIKLPPGQTSKLLAVIQREVKGTPVFPASSTIGGAVAVNTRLWAVLALTASWVCIIIYLWIRFQGVAFGLAAVVALVHDVFVMLGGIALSYYIAPYFGFLGIDPFKINLTIVAAFLTIIGYSVNDTIVVFDRIREVRGKDPNVTRKVVNDSVNQTLSRTLLTSFTVFLVVIVMYIFGGEAVHGFAFALIIGVATGTYSSIYIAAPILLLLVGQRHRVAALMER